MTVATVAAVSLGLLAIAAPATAQQRERGPQSSAEAQALRGCERAVFARVRADKNTERVKVRAEALDDWRRGDGDLGVRGYGEYRSSGDATRFRFLCSYDTRRSIIHAVEYQKVYSTAEDGVWMDEGPKRRRDPRR